MAKETEAESKARLARQRKAARRKELREKRRAAQVQPQGEGVDPNPMHQLEHQIERLSMSLSQLRYTAELVRPRKPRGVEQLHRRVVWFVFDKDGIRIDGSQRDLKVDDALILTVSGSEITAHFQSEGR